MSEEAAETVVAIDLGATSGRVMLGRAGPETLRLEEAARFPNGPVETGDGLHWDIDRLWAGIMRGLTEAGRIAAARGERIRSIGIDSWAVDYGLLRDGRLTAAPFHYRDPRTSAGVAAVHGAIPFDELYLENGLQFLPFNTLYQLAADRDAGRLREADTILLIPDLIAWMLTGETVAEATNASTTGLLRIASEDGGSRSASALRTAPAPVWNDALITRLGMPPELLPPLVTPGTAIGTLTPVVARTTGLDPSIQVIAVGSHDTASAVVGAPMTSQDAAYISCGTWGLVGVETEHPVISEAARSANFTNEGGVDGRTRFLRNVMGLWILSECVRTWRETGLEVELPRLLAEAAVPGAPIAVIDVDDERFMPPGDMPGRIAEYCAEHELPVPGTPADFARVILESLAAAFARAVHQAAELSGKRADVIHLIGGGSQNELLCRLTAERSGLPVLAGPVEATALGNVLVQTRALGAIDGDLGLLRTLVARTHSLRRYP